MSQSAQPQETKKHETNANGLITSLITARATATPQAPAIVCGRQTLSYADLESRANELAARLGGAGAKRDNVIAVCVPRSPAFIVAALAVLKAGGAYLPLDPSTPIARLGFMLEDADVSILLTGTQEIPLAPSRRWTAMQLDSGGRPLQPVSASSASEEIAAAAAESLAYVIYTSGSTGWPKGVEVTHGNLLNLVHWHQQAFKVTEADRATQLARLGFDAAVWEIWPYLAAGACLYLPEEELLGNPEQLRDWLIKNEITISFAPTPVAERLIALDWPEDTAMRALLTGADTLHVYPSHELPFFLVNNYGPTECTVVATSGLVPPGKADHLPPIGRPIAQTQAYVLDDAMHMVPLGVQGELYIGGAGVARGYRNRPELTAQKFVADPFGADTGKKLYRTGDIVKRLADGQLAFIGRKDEQVKVRGFRIETDEVAAALAQFPRMLQSVVTAREIADGERALVAYIVPAKEARIGLAELREFLSARLPDYMVPPTYVVLESIPLTANGKVDRATLPAPDESNTLRDRAQAAPRTETEKTLVGILAPLLGLEDVDVDENFFTMGGHSLLGTQLISRARDVFQVDLPLRLIFEAPTVAQLSAEIERLLLERLESMTEEEAQELLHRTADNAQQQT